MINICDLSLQLIVHFVIQLWMLSVRTHTHTLRERDVFSSRVNNFFLKTVLTYQHAN